MEENARARCVVRDVYRYPTEVERTSLQSSKPCQILRQSFQCYRRFCSYESSKTFERFCCQV